MTLFKPLKPFTDSSMSWFRISLMTVFLVSLGLRFWQLGRFNTLVFDEVYYAKFASNYLTHTQFFDGHPPLSKYIIALGIWIGDHLPFGQTIKNGLSGSLVAPWTYRWLNAITGSFIPMTIAAIAYQLTQRRSYSFLAALFAATDGLFLVESRYALNNVYLVIFGLLGQLLFLMALRSSQLSFFRLLLSGLFFGASFSVKWNGLWFLFGAYLVWLGAWLIRFFQARQSLAAPGRSLDAIDAFSGGMAESPLARVTQLHPVQVIFSWTVVPLAFYCLQWLPHLQLNPTLGLWDVQKEILAYHERIGSGPNVHPYCSPWYTWLLMIRPVAYFYSTAINKFNPVPAPGPTVPLENARYVYDVHAMGNPFLWWFSTTAVLVLLAWLVAEVVTRWAIPPADRAVSLVALTQTPGFWVGFYLVLNYLANLLPWVGVTRCTFLYHYMGSSVFATLAIAWLVDRWLWSPQARLRGIALTAIFLVLSAFVFWLPIYLGIPLSPLGYQARMWFRSWI